MGGRGADTGIPVVALPVDRVCGRLLGHPLPPDVPIVGQGAVGEDAVLLHGLHGVGIGVIVGARRHAEVPVLGVDGIELAIVLGLDPGDVVADGGDLPAIEGLGRDQHGEVGLAAGAGEGRRHIGLLFFGGLDAQNQHVLGEPAVVPGHDGGDAQGQALLTQQGVAAVAAAVGPDLAGLRKMGDVLVIDVRGAGPDDIFLVRFQRGADRMHAGYEFAVVTQDIQNLLAHAGHDPLVDHHIGRVGDLEPDVGDVGAQGTHAEGDHV